MATIEQQIERKKDALKQIKINYKNGTTKVSKEEYNSAITQLESGISELQKSNKNVQESEPTFDETSLIATSFDNDVVYSFIRDVGYSGSIESETNTFKTLKDNETHYNPARNNNFICYIDFYRDTVQKYRNVISSEYITNIKSPILKIKENETVSMGLYKVDLSTIIKSGETISIEVNEREDRGILKDIFGALMVYQTPENQEHGIYSDIRKNFWKIHHTLLDYQGEVQLMAKYICTPDFNIDFMNEYENVKAESYTLDFKVVNYNIYNENGNKLI